MFRKFKFEEIHYSDLLTIPLSTRHKFETIGFLVEEAHWRKLPLEERRVFCHLAIRSQGERDTYKEFMVSAFHRLGVTLRLLEPGALLNQKTEWENPGKIPPQVLETSFRTGTPLRPEDWLGMDDMERYALYKLAASEEKLFLEALREFLKADATAPSHPAPLRRSAQGH